MSNADHSELLKSAVQPVALVAEDDDQISFLLQFLLERENFRVVLAKTGLEAQQLVDRMAAPALALLDIMMPHADGFDVLAHIRAKPEWRAVPVVMLTARSQETDVSRALGAGATAYVVKPFLPEELRATIRSLVVRTC